MIVNLNLAETIEPHTYTSLPKRQQPLSRYKLDDNTVEILRNPLTVGSDNLTFIEYSFMVYNKKDELKFVLSLERINLRELSNLIGTPYRELQEEYGTKTQFSTPRVMLYNAEDKEDYGTYTESLKPEFLFPFLWDILLDATDSISDPVALN